MEQTPIDRAVVLHETAQESEADFRLAEAERLYREAAAILECAEGLLCPDLANVLNDLSSTLEKAGKYEGALQSAEKSLLILNALGDRFEGPDATRILLVALGRCGATLCLLGRYSDAEPILRRAIEVAERGFGPNDDRTASALNELGILFKYSGRFDEAEALYARALSILERNHGPDSRETGSVWHNLGGLEHARAHFAKGEPAARKAWRISLSHFGPEHPRTLADEAALAGLLDGMERYSESEPIYRRVIAAFEQLYGPEHYEVAVNLNNLAGVREARGDIQEAETLYRRSLSIKEKLFGREHLETALTALNFASFLLDQARLDEAASMAQTAGRILCSKLPPDHPNCIAVRQLWEHLRARGYSPDVQDTDHLLGSERLLKAGSFWRIP